MGDDWRLGVLGGYSYSHSRVTLDDRPSWAKSDTYHVGVYGGKQWGQLGRRDLQHGRGRYPPGHCLPGL